MVVNNVKLIKSENIHAIYAIKSCIFTLKTSKKAQNMQDFNVFYS